MALTAWEQGLFLTLLALITLAQLGALLGLVRKRGASDQGSALALVSSWWAVLAVSAIEAWRFPGLLAEPRWLPYLGAIAFFLGLAIRVIAVNTLAKQFSPLVELQEDHALVTHGLYAWVRHPAYVGSLLWALSVPLILGSAIGLAAVAVLYVPALRFRIHVEERLLEGHFGEAFADYQRRVPALFPRPPRRGPASEDQSM